MELVMSWSNYFRLYDFLIRLANTETFAFEARPTRNLLAVEFTLTEFSVEARNLIENFTYTHLA